MERFWKKVKKTDGCWEWSASKDRPGGYGVIRVNWVLYKAHRFMYEHTYGPIPDNYVVCHKCDNPGCVNPEHLFVGTQADNLKDMSKKGRHRRTKTRCKLTQPCVDFIKVSALSQKRLARIFNVHPTTIGDVIRNVTWQ